MSVRVAAPVDWVAYPVRWPVTTTSPIQLAGASWKVCAHADGVASVADEARRRVLRRFFESDADLRAGGILSVMERFIRKKLKGWAGVSARGRACGDEGRGSDWRRHAPRLDRRDRLGDRSLLTLRQGLGQAYKHEMVSAGLLLHGVAGGKDDAVFQFGHPHHAALNLHLVDQSRSRERSAHRDQAAITAGGEGEVTARHVAAVEGWETGRVRDLDLDGLLGAEGWLQAVRVSRTESKSVFIDGSMSDRRPPALLCRQAT